LNPPCFRTGFTPISESEGLAISPILLGCPCSFQAGCRGFDSQLPLQVSLSGRPFEGSGGSSKPACQFFNSPLRLRPHRSPTIFCEFPPSLYIRDPRRGPLVPSNPCTSAVPPSGLGTEAGGRLQRRFQPALFETLEASAKYPSDLRGGLRSSRGGGACNRQQRVRHGLGRPRSNRRPFPISAHAGGRSGARVRFLQCLLRARCCLAYRLLQRRGACPEGPHAPRGGWTAVVPSPSVPPALLFAAQPEFVHAIYNGSRGERTSP
jgi:hypothetical protein